MPRSIYLLGLWGALLVTSWGQAPVALRVQPLLGDTPALNGAFPLAIELESRSGNYRGTLSVSLGGFGTRREYLYPIELPAGARKVVIATPIVNRFGDQVTARFTAPGVSVEARQAIKRVLESDQLVVLVGDAIGGLQVLQQVQLPPLPIQDPYTANTQGTYVATYCRPELFPDEVIALSGVSVTVLGLGAERLRAEQWNALRQWVLAGGALIVPGGAGALYLQNPALQALLPVRPQGTRTVNQLSALARWTDTRPPLGSAIITEARPHTGIVLLQQDGLPMIAIRPYGLGVVVFLAFNPLESPMREYDARARFWKRLLEHALTLPPSTTIAGLHQYQSGSGNNAYNTTTPLSTADIKPPRAWLILTLLSIYFALVVPVNYWILKRLRALDWAWLTTPLIALVFVGLLWRLTGDLYRKSLSSAVQTVLVAHAGETDGYAINSVLFFFPRAGVFDFEFEQSDMVEAGTEPSFGGRTAQIATVRTVEGEPTRVQGYRVSNLSFQWFRYTRRAQLDGAVDGTVRLQRAGKEWRLSAVLTNRCPYDLDALRLITPYGELLLDKLPKGRSRTVTNEALSASPSPHSGIPWQHQALSFSPEVLVRVLASRRAFKGTAFLIARASKPVLAPTLREAADTRAEVVYIIALPLEGSNP